MKEKIDLYEAEQGDIRIGRESLQRRIQVLINANGLGDKIANSLLAAIGAGINSMNGNHSRPKNRQGYQRLRGAVRHAGYDSLNSRK